ncbi:hypothetical protein K9L16_03075 [Candidatus Pacearchaeota archaeon]|nr:hypothetical protein [Candidatus Pacearchaeota archaeon]
MYIYPKEMLGEDRYEKIIKNAIKNSGVKNTHERFWKFNISEKELGLIVIPIMGLCSWGNLGAGFYYEEKLLEYLMKRKLIKNSKKSL